MITKFRQREYSLDLLRILCMLMVVCLHFFSHGNGFTLFGRDTFSLYLGYYIHYLSMVAVNCFVMISGYFLIKQKFSYDKLIRLWFSVLFYSISIFILCYYFEIININLKNIIRTFFPISSKLYWFMTAYFGLYLLFPYLNKMIYALNRDEFRKIIMILTILFSLIPSINIIADQFNLMRGYSLIWFIYLYLVGAYIKLHRVSDRGGIVFIFAYLLLGIIMMGIKIYCMEISNTIYPKILSAYNSIFVLLESVLLFLAFSSININNYFLCKIISKISPLVFGVYLIHEVPYTRNFLWQHILRSLYSNNISIWKYMFLCVFSIFSLGIIVEFLRRLCLGRIENIMLNWLNKNILNWRE